MNAPHADRAITFDAADDFDVINWLYRERRWSDGLPIVPPTLERVERMLGTTRRDRYERIADIAPAYGAATVERIAINGVMAGCDPEHLPVLIAASAAIADPQFNLQAIQATTNPAGVWVILNGPIAQKLDVNAGMNCIGQGTWANCTIGRALRLILQNIGGALPGAMDRATQGFPGKISFCCAENEAASPWEPLHVERGYARDQSTVTVVAAEGTMNMNTHSKEALELARVMGETMVHPPSNEFVHGGEPWFIVSPEHAEVFKRGGMTKAALKRELWKHSAMPASRLSVKELQRARSSRGDITPETILHVSDSPENVMLLVAGGPGTHSVYVPSFGTNRSVTRVID